MGQNTRRDALYVAEGFRSQASRSIVVDVAHSQASRSIAADVTVADVLRRGRDLDGRLEVEVTVFILRGLPGSGKTTYANELLKMSPMGTECVSADHFFERKGRYVFDPEKLPEAHGQCLRKFISAMERGMPTVIIDNVHALAVDMAPYIAIAEAYNRKVMIITVAAKDPAIAFARQTHGVPQSIYDILVEKFRQPLPQRWARHSFRTVTR